MPLLLSLFVKIFFPLLFREKKLWKIKLVTYSKSTYIRMFVNKFSAMLTNFHSPFHVVRIYLILFYIYYDFYIWFSTHFLSQPVHCLSTEIRSLYAHPILFLPRNHAFIIKTSASYLEKSLWTSRLLISTFDIHRNFVNFNCPPFVCFLQTNLDCFFWKIPTFYYF